MLRIDGEPSTEVAAVSQAQERYQVMAACRLSTEGSRALPPTSAPIEPIDSQPPAMILLKNLSGPRSLALIDQCVVSCCNFLTMLFIGRWLPADDFGFFSLSMFGVLFISNLHRALLTQPLNVLGAEEDEALLSARTTVLLRAHWVVVPIGVVLLSLMSVAFFPRLPMALGSASYLACFLLQELVRRYWYTVGRIDRALWTDVVSYAGQIAMLLTVHCFVSVDARCAFAILAATSLVGFFVGLRNIAVVRELTAASVRAVLRQHWNLSRWLLLAVLALWASSQIYPFLITGLGPVVIASFAVSRNVLNVVGVAVQSIVNYLPTRAAVVLGDQGEGAFRSHLLKTLSLAATAGVAFVLLMQIFAEPVLHVLYGGTYDSTTSLLKLLSVGMSFSLIGAVLGSYALAMQDSRSTFLANLGSAFFTVTGGVWLIHSYGMYGAAVAMCLSLAAAAALQGYYVVGGLGRLRARPLAVESYVDRDPEPIHARTSR